MLRTRWLLLASLSAVSVAWAGPVDFVKVIDSSSGFLDQFAAPSYNDNGTVAFWGDYAGTSGSGLFTASAPAFGTIGPVSTVVDTSYQYAGFQYGLVSLNNLDQLGFYARLQNGTSGVFFYDGGATTTVFDTTLTGSHGAVADTNYLPQINDWGEMAFTVAYTNGQSSLYKWSGGGLTELAASGQTSPTGTWYSVFWEFADINNAGTVVAPTRHGGMGGMQLLANDGTNHIWINPIGYGDMIGMGIRPVINNNGVAAFIGRPSWDSEPMFYTTDGSGFSLLHDPGGLGLGTSFAYNDLGTLLYVDHVRVESPLVAVVGGAPLELVRRGDTIEGKVVDYIDISSQSLNNKDWISFYARFTDGSEGVYVAGLPGAVPEPASLFVLLVGGLATRRRRRRTG